MYYYYSHENFDKNFEFIINFIAIWIHTFLQFNNFIQTYKCIHFGPMNDVLPYLSRRCQENRSILAGVHEERKMIRSELRRRIFPGMIAG